MKREVDAVIIGAGSAGLAAAISIESSGIERVLVIDREDFLGGILMQCIHNGFGLHRFKAELTGPEYADRFIKSAVERRIEFMTKTTAIDIKDNGASKLVILLSEKLGYVEVEAKAVILAMGCRERNRGNINIPGTRPSGVMTAGLAQKLINMEGYLPGKEIVILGSGDIGLIMARRLTWEGAKVKAVIEIQPYPGGLNRNIVQCLNDFDIPLYLSHTVTKVCGNRRIKSVEIAPLEAKGVYSKSGRFTLTCDTLLLSVGLIPENELSIKTGVQIDAITGGPVVDAGLMTSVEGIFACGNVLHVHDLVDYVSDESELCGQMAARYIKGELAGDRKIYIKAGNLIRYVLPSYTNNENELLLLLRVVAPAKNVVLRVSSGEELLLSRKFRIVQPSEMLRITLKDVPESLKELEVGFEVGKQ